MKLDFLQVVQLKSAPPSTEFPAGVPAHAFCLKTCQRTLWIFEAAHPRAASLIDTDPNFSVQTGPDAYAFLIRVAAGLESKLVGETEIFGQFKAAWREWELAQATLSFEETEDALPSSFFQNIFEDVKWIRSEYLQGLGSESYGSLTRKWLRKQGVSPDQPLILIGAGKLAHSIAPWVAEYPLYLINRTESAIDGLEFEIRKKAKAPRISRDLTASVFGKPAVALICAPKSSEIDSMLPAGCQVLHLGEEDGGLEALFSLQEDMDADFTRRSKIERAKRGSMDRAMLRQLIERCGGSHGTSHGWEDLALFA